MELDTDEPRMVRTLDRFGQDAVRRQTGETHACGLQRLQLVAVTAEQEDAEAYGRYWRRYVKLQLFRLMRSEDRWLAFARPAKKLAIGAEYWRHMGLWGDAISFGCEEYVMSLPDIEAYDAFYKRLIKRVSLSDVSSTFVMEEIKYTTALPLEPAFVRAVNVWS